MPDISLKGTHPRTFYVCTFGCKANRYDSASIEEQLTALGLEPAADIESAGVVVLNTCTVTATADADARQAVSRARRRNPDCVLVVTGCLATRDPDSVARYAGVSAVIGNPGKDGLAAELRRRFSLGQPEPDGGRRDDDGGRRDDGGGFGERAAREVTHFRGMTRAYVKIQDGCPGGCTYCIVPSVRGPSRSVPEADVMDRIRRLEALGYKEIVLTGIHIGLYAGSGGLLSLLRAVERLPLDLRVRLSSLEIGELSDDLLGLIGQSAKIAPHLHLPLQSGSAAVLADMGRRYTPSTFASWVERAARRIPDAGIGTDVMVGFPTEDEARFEETRHLVDALPLTYLHVFRFSPRPGTAAAGMKQRSPSARVTERARELKALGRGKNLSFRRGLIDRTLPALTLEQVRPVALTGNYVKVRLDRPCTANRLTRVTVTAADETETRGTLEESHEPRHLSGI